MSDCVHLPLLLTAAVHSHHDDLVSLILLLFDGISRASRTDAGFSNAIHPSICGRYSLFCIGFGSNVSTSQTAQPVIGETKAENAVKAAWSNAAIAHPVQGVSS
jgi:hypothetical protein